MITIYKIRNKENGLYSHGTINHYVSRKEKCVRIQKWSTKGKSWTSEKLVKDHLLRCIEFGGIPSTWEIMEFTQQPSKELNEWVDNNMLMKMLKINHNSK